MSRIPYALFNIHQHHDHRCTEKSAIVPVLFWRGVAKEWKKVNSKVIMNGLLVPGSGPEGPEGPEGAFLQSIAEGTCNIHVCY